MGQTSAPNRLVRRSPVLHTPGGSSVAPESVPPTLLPTSSGAEQGPDATATPTGALEYGPASADAVPELAPRAGVLDGLFVVLVCALAFLLAATPARNSDLWLHLASGRLFAQGQMFSGTDPFASTTAGVFWVNPTWLSDALLYGLYQLGDGR